MCRSLLQNSNVENEQLFTGYDLTYIHFARLKIDKQKIQPQLMLNVLVLQFIAIDRYHRFSNRLRKLHANSQKNEQQKRAIKITVFM